MVCSGDEIIMSWERDLICGNEIIMSWKQDLMSCEQDIKLLEQDIFFHMPRCSNIGSIIQQPQQ